MSDALGWAIFGGILVALALVFLVVLLRERRAAERRFEKVMEELTSRMDGMLVELRSTAERNTDEPLGLNRPPNTRGLEEDERQ